MNGPTHGTDGTPDRGNRKPPDVGKSRGPAGADGAGGGDRRKLSDGPDAPRAGAPGRDGADPAVSGRAGAEAGTAEAPSTAPPAGSGLHRDEDRSGALPTGTSPRAVAYGAWERLRAWAELLRVSALLSVPGDALAGAAATGVRPGRGTGWAVGASLCLYEAGMALNDWADREEDAEDRPHRPIPSGRITPGAALLAAGTLTGAGLLCAAQAGRAPLAVAGGLTAAVWAYDLRLKHTFAGPAAMATARALDLLLGATATTVRPTGAPAHALRREGSQALPAPLAAAAALGAHTYAVTAVSRHEVHGGSTAAPLAALATCTALAAWAARPTTPPSTARPPSDTIRSSTLRTAEGAARLPANAVRPAAVLAAAVYLRTAAVPLLHAALNPSAPLTRRAVGGGIRAMVPLQAALAARSGAPVAATALLAVTPIARALTRKVSPT